MLNKTEIVSLQLCLVDWYSACSKRLSSLDTMAGHGTKAVLCLILLCIGGFAQDVNGDAGTILCTEGRTAQYYNYCNIEASRS